MIEAMVSMASGPDLELVADPVGVPRAVGLHGADRVPALQQRDRAALDCEHLAGERALVRGQVADDLGDVRGMERVELALGNLRGEDRAHARRREREAGTGDRRDAVHPHAVPLQFECCDLGECGDAGLGRAVVRLTGVGQEGAGCRGGVDDRRVDRPTRLGLLLPVPGRVPQHRGVALQVHRDDRVPLRLGHRGEERVAQDAGVVDHDVQATELGDRVLDQALRAVPGGDVVGVRVRPSAGRDDLLRDLVGRPGIGALAGVAAAQVVDHDGRALAGQQQGVLPADPAAGAGDHRDLAVQESHGQLTNAASSVNEVARSLRPARSMAAPIAPTIIWPSNVDSRDSAEESPRAVTVMVTASFAPAMPLPLIVSVVGASNALTVQVMVFGMFSTLTTPVRVEPTVGSAGTSLFQDLWMVNHSPQREKSDTTAQTFSWLAGRSTFASILPMVVLLLLWWMSQRLAG